MTAGPYFQKKSNPTFLLCSSLFAGFLFYPPCVLCNYTSTNRLLPQKLHKYYFNAIRVDVTQVLVYLPVFYNRFYKTCVLNNCSESDMVMFLSPVFTEYQGQVQSVGMRYVVDRWIGSKLQVTTKSDEYTSLYMLKTQPELCDELDTLMDDQSVIGLRFRVISTLITDLVKRTWFTEIIDNHIKLREFNL